MRTKEYKQELEKYKKATATAKKIATQLANEESISEDTLNFLSSDSKEHLVEELRNSNETSRMLKNIINSDKQSASDRLLNRIDAVERRNNKRNRIKRITLATITSAAAVIAISFFILNGIPKSEVVNISENNQVKFEQVFLKPTLITSRKEIIELDKDIVNAHDIISVKNNMLTYDKNIKSEQVEYNTIIVPPQQQFKVALSDGTVVTVGANSSLKYPVHFIGDKREVELTGVAYFDVESSKDSPFIVTAKNSYVRVYGTEFNINTHRDDQVRTLLVEGSVGVGVKGGEPIMIEPNNLITLNEKSGKYQVEKVNPADYLSWMSDYIDANNWTMKQLVEEIEEWYDVDIKYTEQDFSDIIFNLSIKRGGDILDALSAINLATPISITINNNKAYEIIKE